MEPRSCDRPDEGAREVCTLDALECATDRALVLLQCVDSATDALRTGSRIERSSTGDVIAHPAYGLLATSALADELERVAARLRRLIDQTTA